MRHATLSALLLASALLLGGCPGGDAGLGEACEGHATCASDLQCLANVCVPRCDRAPECGDGYACGTDGICRRANGQRGDLCTSEVDCESGLSCQIDGTTVDDTGHLIASCTDVNSGRPAGSTCVRDDDCRNGTCELGHCVDLCASTRDCGEGTSCIETPRVTPPATGELFHACLPAQGNIAWSIPVISPDAEVLLPVPKGARYASLVFGVDDESQRVGAKSVIAPSGASVYTLPCDPTAATCREADFQRQYYLDNAIRHLPAAGQSVLAMPSNPDVALETGAYRVRASSFRPGNASGSAIPNITAVIRMDTSAILDLHLYFLDLEDHPCEDGEALAGTRLDAAAASAEAFFQNEFLGQLRGIFARGGIALGGITYEDIKDHPELDGLDANDGGALLALGAHARGINVFFVRTLSPVGLQAFGPGPGPAGLASTRRSGIAIGVDTLCYRSWPQLARLTAHEIARYMGLYHNVERDPAWGDPIADSDDSPNNLLFFSELGGTDLSADQRDILTRSPVLR